LAKKYFDGSVLNTPITLALRKTGSGTNEIQANIVRGLYYKLQSTTNLSVAFSDEPGGSTLVYDSPVIITNISPASQKYYRMTGSLGP
jgi:hypothetical protein